MTHDRRVLVHADKSALIDSVAARFITKMADILHEQGHAHVVLTGGTVGTGVLEAINASPDRDSVDWAKIDFWWGDERWVPRTHADRNEVQARAALLDHIDIPAANVHSFPASDEGLDLDAAADRYAAELKTKAAPDSLVPQFDVTFLGVGPDGHIASLFPHMQGIRENDLTVIAVLNSPKPPSERLSLTRWVINSSERIWLVVSGTDKASALGLALAGASRDEVPVAGIRGRHYTDFFVDGEAAAEVPENLIAQPH
ncbi:MULTISPECIES: 6-phosphogluconolactonase [Cryobacterium]|uniref:6-phosphogluconolactonase n=1 Tax=Cryobacterium TaxID=69578 RepID=UPI000CD3E57D|nr:MULTISPECIES: 6-phosphogluconolactonase [Cryobacterium]POH65479.1 6-phosphogluconolactonase [Cryobacterium zongtaii]TFC45177.1 6-phosphogluconolactonase [Cryobacterium sp. TMN-39-2]